VIHRLAYSELWSAYWCLGCGELVQVPTWDVLRMGETAVRIKGHPQHQLLWREARERDHERCHANRLVDPRTTRAPWSLIQ
jgi:hypothetical protein